MNKRDFLKTTAVLTTATFINPFEVLSLNKTNFIQEIGEFTLPELPFATNALQPYIDQLTMETHHGKHHAGYVKNLNAAIAGTGFAEMTLVEIMGNSQPTDTAIRNNGGGHYNHSLFWKILTPESQVPTGDFLYALENQFGSLEQFQETFTKTATSVFGSGWVWLIVDAQKNLQIVSTANQDNPLMQGIVNVVGTPILGLDVWEHAYYLTYQNKRADYIASFWKIVNWRTVEQLWTEAMR